MNNLFEKVALQLEQAADYIEAREKEAHAISEKEINEKKLAEEKKKEELITPLKEKLSSVSDEGINVEDKLKDLSIDTLEFLDKSVNKIAQIDDKNVWGNIEENKTGKGQKFGGYKDPLEAFAMS